MQRSDEKLIRAYREGDETSCEELIRRYARKIRGLARTYFIIGADTDDTAQEATIGLLKAIRTYDESKGASFSTYAGRCMTRQILDAMKAAARKKHMPLNDSLSLDSPASEDSAETMESVLEVPYADSSRLSVILDDVMEYVGENRDSAFSKMEIDVWNLYMKGLSYNEIAYELGKNQKSVYNAMERTRKKVLAYLGER